MVQNLLVNGVAFQYSIVVVLAIFGLVFWLLLGVLLLVDPLSSGVCIFLGLLGGKAINILCLFTLFAIVSCTIYLHVALHIIHYICTT